MEGRIYKITNLVNGKIYIGQTIQTLKQRWWRHCSESSECMPIHKAIVKYGNHNFKMELLEEVDTDILDEKEIYYIALYNSTDSNIGYNLMKGGRSVQRPCSLTKEQEDEVIRLKNKGYSSADLGKMFGVDKGTIKNIFIRHNEKMPIKKPNNIQSRH